MSQVGKSLECRHAQTALIEFRLNRQQGATLYPAMTYLLVLRKALRIPGRTEEFVGFPDACPPVFHEVEIPAGHRIFIHGDNEQRCGIC